MSRAGTRGGTAAPQSQPASILKPSTSHPHPSTRGGGSRGQTGGGSRAQTGYSEETGSQPYTAQSGRTNFSQGQSRGQTGDRKPVSLFDVVNAAKAGGGGGTDEVKTDNIWSKFVSDDENVVRAPTASTRVSGGSQGSYRSGSQVTGSQGSQRPSQIDEEEEEEEEESDDDRTIYSDYYLPPAYQRPEGTPEPRAEIVDSHEACSCFPDRSNRLLGSMLYDKITCKHTGLTGHTQPGVFKFNPFWNESMEIPRRLRKRDMNISKTKFVFGYPKPRFEFLSDTEDEEEYDEDEEGQGEEEVEDNDADDRSKHPDTPKTAKTAKTSGSDDENEEYDSEEYDDDEYDDDDDEDDEDYIPFELPQIGYPQTPSLPPSSRQSFRSRYSDFTDSQYAESLPSLPASRQLTAQTAHSRRTGVTQRTQHTQFTLPNERQETKRSTRTAKTEKTQKSKAKSSKSEKEESIDSGYDDGISRRTMESRQSLPAGPVISAARTFQGKFYDPVTKQVMLYDIGTRPGERMPTGNIEPLNKPPPTAETQKGGKKSPSKSVAGSKPGSKDSKRSRTSQLSVRPTAAALGNVFLSNLLSKNKKNKEDYEAGYDDEEDGN